MAMRAAALQINTLFTPTLNLTHPPAQALEPRWLSGGLPPCDRARLCRIRAPGPCALLQR